MRFGLVKWLMVVVLLAVLSGCGGGGNNGTKRVDKFLVFEKYAESNGTTTLPALTDYSQVGVTGVTADNIMIINVKIADHNRDGVDEQSEIQEIVDAYLASQQPTEDRAAVNLDIKNIDIKDLGDCTLVSSSGQVDVAHIDELNQSINQKSVVALVGSAGEPILIGKKSSGADKVDISLESSAEVFVLFHPRFNGVAANDPQELSRRIRSSDNFPKLVDAIKKAIDAKSPCPLDPGCNWRARDIATKIVDHLDLADLYTIGGNK